MLVGGHSETDYTLLAAGREVTSDLLGVAVPEQNLACPCHKEGGQDQTATMHKTNVKSLTNGAMQVQYQPAQRTPCRAQAQTDAEPTDGNEAAHEQERD